MQTRIARWTALGIALIGAPACTSEMDPEPCTPDAGMHSMASDMAANNATTANGMTSTNGMTGDAGPPLSWWKPAPGTTWQWQLSGTIDTSVDVEMYDVDLFDTPQSTIDQLHADGRIVICYFSAGTYEDWRPDKAEFASADYGRELPDWPGEFWLDTGSANVRRIMGERLDMAVAKGCDGVEPDNMDGYANDNGIGLSCDSQMNYNRFVAGEAHNRGLSIGLKNAVELVPDLEPFYDWALNEECFEYDECNALQPFLAANKAVFHTEYVNRQGQGEGKRDDVCGNLPAGFSTLIKLWDLDAWVLTCP